MSGDLLQQFSIDARSGDITVRTALDREEVSVLRNNVSCVALKKQQVT